MKEGFSFEKPRKQPEKQLEKLPDNVSIIDLPEARYRFLYERHDLTHSTKELGNADALVLENVQKDDYSDPQKAAKAIDDWFLSSYERHTLPDKETAQKAVVAFQACLELKHTPQYLVDIVDPKREYIHLLEKGQQLLNIEGVIGGAAGGYLAAKDVDKGLSRRSFLTGLAAAAMTSKAALNTVNNSAEEVSNKKLSAGRRAIQEVNEAVNPELPGIMVKYRNAIWAIKLHAIAKKLRDSHSDSKPEIAMQLGKNHSGIEDMLRRDPADVLDYINNMTHVLSKFIRFGPDGVMISPIAKLEYNERTEKWEASETGKDKDLIAIENGLR